MLHVQHDCNRDVVCPVSEKYTSIFMKINVFC